MSVLGGTRHWAGPAVGAVAITALLYAFTGGSDARGRQGADRRDPDRRHPVHARGHPRPARCKRCAAAQAARALRRRSPSGCDASAHAAHRRCRRAAARACSGRRARRSAACRRSRGVDLEVRRGEILGLLGPERLGQVDASSTWSAATTPPTAARSASRATSWSALPAHRIARAGIARTYQIPRPFAHMSVLRQRGAAAMFGGAVHGSRRRPRREAMALARVHRPAGKAHALPGRAEPAPAQVPRAGARARVAAAAGAARRGAVRPDAGRDRRRRRADPRASATRARPSSSSST